MKKIRAELLAPAGNPEGFYRALHAGADAVYLGGSRFGARAYADNFTEEELVACIRYAHLLDRRVYLTVNTLVREDEFQELYGYLLPYYEAGLDGVIVQDIGVFLFIRDHFPGMKLHVSTQMTLTGKYGAAFLRELGADRIVPARELSLQEITQLKAYSGVEVETFIHGAMCYCYSGQCLFSSLLGGRSGNRGRCAQPCRLPYQVERQGRRLGEGYPLSLKDMCTAEQLPRLLEAGIDSLKIEGRMKKPEYTAGVTAIYRKYIDLWYERPEGEFKVSQEDLDSLSSLYIRTDRQDGYYWKHNGADMVTLDSPAYAGSDEALLARIRSRFPSERKTFPLSVRADLRLGSPAEVYLTAEGLTVRVTGSEPEPARSRPVTKENVEKQLTKFGGTVFYVSGQEINLDDGLFYSLKELNELRRRAAADLEDKIIENNGLCSGRTADVTGMSGVTGASGCTGMPGVTRTADSNGMPGVTGTADSNRMPGVTGTADSNGMPGGTGTADSNRMPGGTGTADSNRMPGVTGTADSNGMPGVTGTADSNGIPGGTGASGVTGMPGGTGASGVTGMLDGAGASGVTGMPGGTGTSDGAGPADAARPAYGRRMTEAGEPETGRVSSGSGAFAGTRDAGAAADKSGKAATEGGLHISLRTKEQWEAFRGLLKQSGFSVKRLYLDGDMFSDNRTEQYRTAAGLCNEAGISVFLALPRIVRRRDEKFLEEMLSLLALPGIRGCMARSIEGYAYLEKKYAGDICGDAGIYQWNAETLRFWRKRLCGFTLPYELNLAQQQPLLREAEKLSFSAEKVVYGRIPMMVTANCVVKTMGCCPAGGEDTGGTALIDRYGKAFPVEVNCAHCMNVIYNSVPLSLHVRPENWLGTVSPRLDFTAEDGKQTESTVCFFRELLSGEKSCAGTGKPPYEEYTAGHEKRGAL